MYPERIQPPILKFGTCSWKYDSWRGIVYSNAPKLNYLAVYARHFDCVKVDQWYWSFIRVRGGPSILCARQPLRTLQRLDRQRVAVMFTNETSGAPACDTVVPACRGWNPAEAMRGLCVGRVASAKTNRPPSVAAYSRQRQEEACSARGSLS